MLAEEFPIAFMREVYEVTRPLMTAIERTTGFEVPERTRKKLERVMDALTDEPLAPPLARLMRVAPTKPDWLQRLRTKIAVDVAEGLAACHYHLDNIARLEQELHEVVLASTGPLLELLDRPLTQGGGDTRRLDFEYQAFHLALRRTFEYFASSIGAFFKRDVNRIRRLDEAIRDADPSEYRESVRMVLQRHGQTIENALSEGTTLTVRDQICHWNPVGAGTFNIVYSPERGLTIGLIGGGERLRLDTLLRRDDPPEAGVGLLREGLANHLSAVEDLAFEAYHALRLG